ncbi:DNA-directed RNA polymerase [Segatella salivae]|nr:DNA-directed RNA polymerase [Segatella salivae]
MNHATNNKSIRISQRCKRCTFDSPGLSSDSADYPGLMYGLRGTTP